MSGKVNGLAGGELRVVVDKRGRTFERGAAVTGKPGVVVAGIRRIGSWTTVRFGPERVAPKVPGPIVLHDDDVRGWE